MADLDWVLVLLDYSFNRRGDGSVSSDGRGHVTN